MSEWSAAFPSGVFVPGYGPPLNYFTPNAAGFVGGNPDVTPYLTGKITSPEPEEVGWKDTFKMYPGQVSRVIVRWAPQELPVNAPYSSKPYPFDPSSGPGYVWHCHIVDHEDNEMMRPYKVV